MYLEWFFKEKAAGEKSLEEAQRMQNKGRKRKIDRGER